MSPPSEVPDTRPVDADALLDRLHADVRRLHGAWAAAVDAERAYERQRAAVIDSFVRAGESPSTAERHARIDPDVLELHHQLVDARSHVHRLETFCGHWRYLIDHLPSD